MSSTNGESVLRKDEDDARATGTPIEGRSAVVTAYDDLFELPADQLDFAVLRRFLATAEEVNALAESKVIELKLKRTGDNLVVAVAGLSNSDGGVVLVGLNGAKHSDDRIVGVSSSERDAIVAQLHALIPDAMSDVIALAVPDEVDRCVVVLRVDADAVPHPVVVGGKVVVRIPGHTVPADRDDIRALAHRDDVGRGSMTGSTYSSFSPAKCDLWTRRIPRLELRTFGTVRLPARVLNHAWFGTGAKEAAAVALRESPLPDVLWSAAQKPLRCHPWIISDARSNWFRLVSEARSAARRR